MVDVLLLQSSLRKDSRTAVVIEETARVLRNLNISHEIVDFRDYNLPFCDGRSLQEYISEYPDVKILHEKMKLAKSFVIGYPVYLYTISGVLKNYLDILGKPMTNKHYGIIANAGGTNGYMSSNDLINSLLYDFNSTAIMPQVYSARKDFDQSSDGSWKLTAFKPIEKVEQMVQALIPYIEKIDEIKA